MGRPFLEEQVFIDPKYGTSFDEAYAVTNTIDAGGNSYAHIAHPHPMLRYDLNYGNSTRQFTREHILDIFHRSFGTLGGFRLKHHADFSTHNFVDEPTFADQKMRPALVAPSALRWQLCRWYGVQSLGESPLRLIRKPVAGSVLVGIKSLTGQDFAQPAGWSVDTATGIVEFTDNAKSITSITKGTTTVITVGSGHGYTMGQNAYIADVEGMTQINGLRANILSTDTNTITVDINSVSFDDRTGGGTTRTAPQPGEQPLCGCYFDIPVRFEANLSAMNFSNWDLISSSINVVEILNP